MLLLIKNLIVGVFIGISNVIPGVSGGTIACILNVYEELLALPSLNIKLLKKESKSIFSLYSGMLIGILLFSKLVTYVYSNYPIYTSYFFVGVIFASFVFLYEKSSEKKQGKSNLSNKLVKIFIFLLAFFIMFLISILKKRGITLSFYESANSYNLNFYILLSFYCAIATCGMIIPGISGSFLLLILGVYKIVIEAISSFNLKLILFIGVGVLLGAISTARLIKFLITQFRTFTYSFIFGLTAGSIIHIFPFACQPFMQRFISALFLLLGYTIVTIFIRTNNFNKEDENE